MATFVLIPGAGGHAAYWNRLIPELETRGQRAIAVDIKEDDPSMDLDGFAAVVEATMGDDSDVILVAQSLGGFTAPMVRKPVQMIVLLNAMIPRSNDASQKTGLGSMPTRSRAVTWSRSAIRPGWPTCWLRTRQNAERRANAVRVCGSLRDQPTRTPGSLASVGLLAEPLG